MNAVVTPRAMMTSGIGSTKDMDISGTELLHQMLGKALPNPEKIRRTQLATNNVETDFTESINGVDLFPT